MKIQFGALRLVLIGLLSMALPLISPAATLTWDADTATAGAQDGPGTWSNVGTNWWTGSANAAFNTNTPDIATFGAASGPAGTVTLGSTPLKSSNIIFSAAGGGHYIIAGGGNSLALSNVTITVNVDATISAPIVGTTVTTANSSANAPSAVLTLTGNNSFVTAINIGANAANTTGAIRAGGNNALGASSSSISFGGGQGTQTSHRLELAGGITLGNSSTVAGRNNQSAGIVNVSGTNTLTGTFTRTTGGADFHIASEVANGLIFSGATALSSSAAAPRNYVLRGSGGGTVSGIISLGSSSLGIVKAESGTWTLSGGPNTFANNAIINQGTLVLDYSTQNNNKWATTTPLTLAGGTLSLFGGSFSQVAASTTIGVGGSAVTRSGGNSALRMNAITRSRGGVIDFSGSSIADCDNNDVFGILGGGYATIGGADWAHTITTGAGDTAITTYTGYTDIDAFGSTIADGLVANVRLNSAAGSGSIVPAAATTTIQTLLQNTTAAATIDTSANILRLGTNGAVLLPGGKAGLTIGTSAGSGTFTAGGTANAGGEIILINNDATSDILVNSVVANNGTGPVSLTKAGSGTATLAASNTHTGTNTVAAGTLNVSSDANFGAAPGAAIVGMIVIHGGVLNATASFTLNANRGLQVGPQSRYGNGTISVASGQTLTYNGIIANFDLTANGPGGSLTKTGPGTLVLGGNNTYGGRTFILGGTLQISADNNLAGSPANAAGVPQCYQPDSIVINGATLQVATGFTMSANRGLLLGPVGGSGSGTIGVASGQTLSYPGRMADNWGGAGSLVKNDLGTLTLTSAFNDYSGDTTVGAGTLKIGNARAIPTGVGKGNLVLEGTLDANNTSFSVNGLSGTAGIVDNTTAGSPTFSVGFNNASSTFGGVIKNTAGTLALAKYGTGTLTLTSANTYGGNTTVNQGALALSGSGSFTNSPIITVASGAVLDVSSVSFALKGSQSLSGGGVVSGNVSDSSGSVIFPGGSNTVGTLTFSNSLTLTGGGSIKFDFSSTTNDVIVVNGSLSPSGVTTINLANLPTLGLVTGDYALFQVSGVLSGTTNNFVITGKPNPTRQTFDLVYSGNQVLLRVGGGVATLAWLGGLNGNVWDATNTLNFTNLTANLLDVYFDGDKVTFGDAGAANPPVLNQVLAPGTLTVNAASAYTLSGTGSIKGSTGLMKTNSGTLTINTPTNAYTGVTYLGGGVVAVTNLANGGSASPMGAASSASANVVYDGGTLQYNGPVSASPDRGATLNAGGGTIQVSAAANTVTVSGAIVGNSGGGLSKTGSGTLALNAANTYNGPTTISGGTLQLGGANGSVGTGPVTNNGALAVSITGSSSIAALAGAGPLTNSGAGVLTLGGSGGFNGAIYHNAGTLLINSSGALGVSAITLTSTTGGAQGGTRVTLSGGIAIPSTVSLSMPSAATTVRSALFSTGGATNIWNGPISLNGNDNISFGGDSGLLVIAGNVTGDSAAGTLQLRGINGRITGAINRPSGNVVVTDGVTWTIQPPSPGVNSWNGSSIVAGTLQLGTDNALPLATVVGFGQTGGAGVLDLAGFNQQLGGVSFLAGTQSSQWITNSSATDSTLTIATTNSFTFPGLLVDAAGKLGLTLNGGSLALSGANTYRGPTAVNAGFLSIGNATALGATNGGTTVAGGAELDVNSSLALAESVTFSGTGAGGGGALHQGGSSTVTWGGALSLGADATIKLDGGCTVNITNAVDTAGHILTLSGDGGTVGNVSAVVQGAGGFTKAGSITATLSGASAYDGNTLVSAGSLTVSGSLTNNASVVVAAGAALNLTGKITTGQATNNGTLAGSGTLLSPLYVQSGGTLAPGSGIATLTVSNAVTLAGTVAMEINRTNTQTADLVRGMTTLAYGGTLMVNNTGSTLTNGDSFTLFTAGSYSGTFTNIVLPVLPASSYWVTNSLYTSGAISILPVPPSAPLAALDVAEGGAITADLGVVNPGGVPLQFGFVATGTTNYSSARGGSFSVDATGHITYGNPTDFNGSESVQYYVYNGFTYVTGTVDIAVVFVNDIRPAVFTNGVSYGTITNPIGLAIADYTGDKKLDAVLVSGSTNLIEVWRGNGTGALSSASAVVSAGALHGNGARSAFGAAGLAGTVSNLVVVSAPGNLDTNAWVDILKHTAGTFTVDASLRVGTGAVAAAAGPLAGKGIAALAVGGTQGSDGFVQVWRKTGTAASAGWTNSATRVLAGTPVHAVAIGNAAGNTNLDVVVAAGADKVIVLTGNGNGTLALGQTDYTVGAGPVAVTVADVNNDSVADVVTANATSDDISVLLGTNNAGNISLVSGGSYGVGEDVGWSPSALGLADLNRDGRLDAVVTLSGVDAIMVLQGQNSANLFRFLWEDSDVFFGVGATPTAVAFGDLNADSSVDAVVANSASADVTVLLNNYTPMTSGSQTLGLLEDHSKSLTLRGSAGPLDYWLTKAPTNGSLTGADIALGHLAGSYLVLATNQTGPITLSYLGVTNAYGKDVFQYVVWDGVKTSLVATVSLTITNVNDAPTFNLATNPVTVGEDSGQTTIVGAVTNITAGAANEKDTESFVLTLDNPAQSNLFKVKPVLDKTGKLTFTVAGNQFGTAVVNVVETDTGGTLFGGVNTTTGNFAIRIVNSNDAPVISTLKNLTLNEGDLTNLTVTLTDLETPPGLLTLEASVDKPEFFPGGIFTEIAPSIHSGLIDLTRADGNETNGQWNMELRPAVQAYGKVTITLSAADPQHRAATNRSAVLTLNAVNDAPSYTVEATALTTGNTASLLTNSLLVASHFDLGDGNTFETNQSLKFFVVGNDNAALFSKAPAVSTNGVLSFVLKGGHTIGTATFKIYAQDNLGKGNGGKDLSVTNLFTVTVTNVLDTPDATNLLVSTKEDVVANITLKGTNYDSFDATYDPGLRFFIVGGPSYGTLNTTSLNRAYTNANPTVSYTPNANFNGADLFQYRVYTDKYTSAVATVSITVTALNDKPTFTLSTNAVDVGTNGAAITRNGFAADPSAGAADEADTLTFVLTGYTAGNFTAAPVINSAGVLTFTPKAGKIFTNTVTVVLKDNGSPALSSTTTNFTLLVFPNGGH